MKGRCKTGGCGLERPRDGFCDRNGRGPNSEGMCCEGLKGDEDGWT
jgi:hypothetical protein